MNVSIVDRYATSTPLLEEGEMVYKIIGEINKVKAKTTFKTYNNVLNPKQITEMILGSNQSFEAIAKHKHNNKLYRISTHLLGYVRGTRVVGRQEGVIENPVLCGYDIQWERKMGGYYNNFEDETLLLRLSDIIILDPDSLRMELINGSQAGSNK